MNYGKSAYLKVLDIEKELAFNKTSSNSLTYYENFKPNIDFSITKNNNYLLSLDKINVQKNQDICFQIKTSLYSNITAFLDVELLVNNSVIHTETKTVYSQECDVLVIKTFTPLVSGEINVSLNFKTKTDNCSITIKDISSVIIGADGKDLSTSLELRVLKINDNECIISYIENSELYYVKTTLNEKSLNSEDFNFLLPAKSHSFSLNKEKDNVILYRVNPEGNLYYSLIFNNKNETFIDSDVDVVFSCQCPIVSDDFNIIAYIKNGRCYYRTFRDTGFTTEKELPLPPGNYVDINITTSSESESLYIIASHKNGSNYILHSLIETSTGKITEFLQANYLFVVTKYIDLSFSNKLSTENISVNISSIIKAISYASKLIENQTTEKLSANYSLKTQTYSAEQSVVYGVKLDKSVLTGTEWGSYTDDCASFSGAYMDFNSSTFISNGWTERWPFNQIKPCLMKNNTVVGYLDPNDYTKFEDGNSADITNLSLEENAFLMVEIPKIYYSITRDSNFIYVKISNKSQSGFVCDAHTYKGKEVDKLYVSAYLCGTNNISSNGYITPSGASLSTTVSMGYEYLYTNMRNKHGDGYEFLPYNVVNLIQCLFIIMFKNTNSQNTLGYGYNSGVSNHTVGQLNDKGMYYGTQAAGTGIKFLGLEDIYGARKQLCIGFYKDSSNRGRYIDVHNQNSSYDPNNIADYLVSPGFMVPTKYARVALDINDDAIHSGFFATEVSTNRLLGFCDNMSLSTSASTTCADYGVNGSSTSNGIFAISLMPARNQDKTKSARIVYYP